MWNDLFLPCEIVRHWQTYHKSCSHLLEMDQLIHGVQIVLCECSHSLARLFQGTHSYGVKHYGDKIHLLFPSDTFIVAPGPGTTMVTYLKTE